ncbi:MAG: hypothetical protein JWO67_1113 [Streptosporangiaceae bacterium]|nr:hypothetical protein [Streptosporangiaceae bacterium]
MKHVALTVASWWPTWVLFGLVAWGGLGLLLIWAVYRFHCWQAGRTVPYLPTEAGLGALADAVTCHWCKPGPKGPCTCGVACGHELCPRLSRADLAYTDHGAEMPR